MTDDDDQDYDEEFAYFIGECTCFHDQDDHGWGECGVEGCDCQAGWEE